MSVVLLLFSFYCVHKRVIGNLVFISDIFHVSGVIIIYSPVESFKLDAGAGVEVHVDCGFGVFFNGDPEYELHCSKLYYV